MALKAVTCQSLSRGGGVSDCEKGAGAAPAPVPGVKVEGETDPRIPFFVSVGAAPVNPPVLKRFEFGLITPTLPI